MQDTTEYQLVVAFTDESPSFAHGFEMGMIYQRMQSGEACIEGYVHSANGIVLDHMLQHCGYANIIDESLISFYGPEWLYIELHKIQKTTTQINPHGLKIIKEDV